VVASTPEEFRELIELEIAKFRGRSFRWPVFPPALEARFEREEAETRSYRLWVEGLIAIVVFNLCLLADFLLVKDRALIEVVKQSELVTPVALLVNAMMRMRLAGWAREGSVALGMGIITCINLYVEGGNTAARAMFQVMSVLITMLFVNVVMRLRFPYAVGSTLLMASTGAWYGLAANGLKSSEQTIALSMLGLGMVMTLTAAYSLERQERLNYLLYHSSALQSAELHRLSNVDRLTELPNRRALEERFEALWKQGMISRDSLSVIVIDIDFFKTVNDAHGHLYGDEVLRRVAELLPSALRPADMVARFGGEEFVILLPGLGHGAAVDVAERIRGMVEKKGTVPVAPGNLDPMLRVTVSCGVSSCIPGNELNRERLLKRADRALYRAKEEGRNRVVFQPFNPHPVHAEEEISNARASGERRIARIREINRYR